MNYDCIVIGGGFAGLTAANVLAGRGLKVIVLEAGSSNSYFFDSRISTWYIARDLPNTRDRIWYFILINYGDE